MDMKKNMSMLPPPPPYVLPFLGDALYWFAGRRLRSSSAPPQHNIAQSSLVQPLVSISHFIKSKQYPMNDLKMLQGSKFLYHVSYCILYMYITIDTAFEIQIQFKNPQM